MDVKLDSGDAGGNPRKRKLEKKKGGGKGKRRMKGIENAGQPKTKRRLKMKKLVKKRLREYNSDDDNDNDELDAQVGTSVDVHAGGHEDASSSEDEGHDDVEVEDEMGGSDDEGDEIHEGTKFFEGIRAFKAAFLKIMDTKISDDVVSSILSARKKLIAGKLAEEEAEQKVKAEAKKEKHLLKEKGHVKPANFLDTKEKFLISVATKGVVKLFNAVSKAQSTQKGLNPSRSKDAKALDKKRKDTFFSELRKPLQLSADDNFVKSKGYATSQQEDSNEPGWAPLRDSYMLSDSKLKDWDKMPDPTATVVSNEISMDMLSDDE